MKQKEWFAEWFDTEYYHALYSHRDADEALNFIRNLLKLLDLPVGSKVADIACGKGRHSMVLANEGCNVHGYDLSKNSIDYAMSQATENTHFHVHDIRQPYNESGFKAAFNLFTSFGYFDSETEDLSAIRNVYDMLDADSWFVQDYINGNPVLKTLPVHQNLGKCDFDFQIRKYFQAPYIIKEIDVDTGDAVKHFSEKVKVYSEQELIHLHTECGFKVQHVFGDYHLNPFDSAVSPRIIIVSKK